jgi:phosphate:Na+ symporter
MCRSGTPCMNWIDIVLGLIGGLTVFLYAMSKLGGLLKETAGEKSRRLLSRMTSNVITGLLSGIVATILLDSSSVTIILVIALVHAGALSFERSLAVILGSNIGTKLSSQIFAIEVDRFAPLVMVLGLAWALAARNKSTHGYGHAVFFLGLILYGLNLMGDAVQPLREHGSVERLLRELESPLSGVAAGAAGTALIQSSSAMMGIVIKLAAAGLLSLKAGVAVMLGAEIGTCVDTLLASVGRSREAIRAGVFQLLFTCITVAAGIGLIQPIENAARWLPGDTAARQIANAHVLFNTAGALLFLPLIPFCAAVLTALVKPEAAEIQQPAAETA